MDISLAIPFLLGLSSLAVYGIILAGWSSNSKYAFFGGLRSAAQMISYEVSLSLILIPIFSYSESFNLLDIMFDQKIKGVNCYFFFPLLIMFFISALAETNRTPFDLPEAEAELVSGYNVEYSGFGFAFFFIAEYLNIIFMSCFISIVFFGGTLGFNGIFMVPFFIFKVFFWLWVFICIRAILPRYRYDQLMWIGWKVLLPLSLLFFLFYFILFVLLLI
jgi:NADH-quinone oxidoreductase subunit H